MCRRSFLLGLGFAFSFVVFACAGGPVRAAESNCDGSLTGRISASVVVPAGRTCTIYQADIEGDVRVSPNATLLVDGEEEWSNIEGNIDAKGCASALLEGSVTVGGNVSIQGCMGTSGFSGPGIDVNGNFVCSNNNAACLATFGKVAGDLIVAHNRSASVSATSDISFSVIGGNLTCQANAPATTHALGGNWVKGGLSGQCGSDLGFAATPYQCAELAGISLPDTSISVAELSMQGAVITGTVTAPVALCRVVGNINPSTNPLHDSNINFELWLPTANWSGRYEQVGNGGFAGSIRYVFDAASMQVAASNNNATASTDDGSGNPGQPSGSFALGHPQKINDYAYRAVHRTALDADVLLAAFYGAPASHRYFNGCSKGGAEGLIEAQRYPVDFDGILAGDPLISLDAFVPGAAWDVLHAANPNNPAGFIPSSSLSAITATAQNVCANAKTVATDNFLGNPLQCRLNTLITPTLSLQQQLSLDAIYQGPINSAGVPLAPGLEPGNEAQIWPVPTNNIIEETLTPVPTTGQYLLLDPVFTYFMQRPVSAFNLFTDFNIDTSFAELDSFEIVPPSPGSSRQTIGAVLNAANSDLNAFRANGGKILQYHGWSDQLVAPRNSINYYETVVEDAARNDSDSRQGLTETQDFYRLLMVPGMGHCRGGPGLTEFGQNGGAGSASSDIFSALELWVEQGTAPSQIVATDSAPPPILHRPLCPYPQEAVYLGRGDTNDAANFACR